MSYTILACRRFACAVLASALIVGSIRAEERSVLPLPEAEAKSAKEMKPYAELIEHTDAKIEMVPIPGGKFTMGAPKGEEHSKDDERPQHEVEIDPFWMGKFEITWDAYEVWMFDLDIQRRIAFSREETPRDKASEEYQIAQPTEPYTDMSFGMGKRGGYPAICMTQLAAKTYCDWLSTKTGRYYRLPTEAEWEYACRAGTSTAYSFGDDAADLEDYGWFFDNSSEKYQKVGKKKPNPWGLYDMHGNVSEWTLDQYSTDFYAKCKELGQVKNPLNNPKTEYPIAVRGGSWNDDPEILRSASRIASHPDWKRQDPQIPKSIWYFTDAQFVGFRVVRPLVEPSAAERKEKWDKAEPVWDRKKGRQ